MDDIRRQDLRLFLSELSSPSRIMASIALGAFGYFVAKVRTGFGGGFPEGAWLAWAVILIAMAGAAYSMSVKRRFYNKRYEALWHGCQDRLSRFEEVLKKLRKDQIADLTEMPRTIRRVAGSLYLALRRADIIQHEVSATEHDLHSPPVWQAASNDPQSKELYRIADKNIAEYRQRYEGVMAGVQRTEAQSAVYMTTLDTLRMKMLGYRLVGRAPEMSSQDFLEALSEAKLQLQAIDTALEELELGPYPTMIAAMPPPIPDEVRERLEQG